jgi:hypothetical protein
MCSEVTPRSQNANVMIGSPARGSEIENARERRRCWWRWAQAPTSRDYRNITAERRRHGTRVRWNNKGRALLADDYFQDTGQDRRHDNRAVRSATARCRVNNGQQSCANPRKVGQASTGLSLNRSPARESEKPRPKCSRRVPVPAEAMRVPLSSRGAQCATSRQAPLRFRRRCSLRKTCIRRHARV